MTQDPAVRRKKCCPQCGFNYGAMWLIRFHGQGAKCKKCGTMLSHDGINYVCELLFIFSIGLAWFQSAIIFFTLAYFFPELKNLLVKDAEGNYSDSANAVALILLVTTPFLNFVIFSVILPACRKNIGYLSEKKTQSVSGSNADTI
ncbi:MAG: hypothetical protein LBU11_09630 [Zoogloeaceae bacterium]|nr:hypothetical protein [Zoogloeaceae bacterium]